MPWGLTRFQHSGQSHFVTFCCYHRRPLLTTGARRRIFESALERARHTFKLQVYGYVVMPEGGWPSLSVADAMIKRVPHSSRTLRRVGTMQLAVPFFDFPENLIIQAARTRPCKKRKDGAPFSYFVPKILKAGPPAPKNAKERGTRRVSDFIHSRPGPPAPNTISLLFVGVRKARNLVGPQLKLESLLCVEAEYLVVRRIWRGSSSRQDEVTPR